MKKICPECAHENDYSFEKCEKCGAALSLDKTYKICPRCGKEFNNVKTECDACREKLVVVGGRAAKVYEEKEDKRAIATWVKIVGVFLPVIGIIIAVVYAINKAEDKLITREDEKTFILTCVFGQLVICFFLYFVFSFIFGNGTGIMKQYFGG